MIAELTIDLGAIARNADALGDLVAPARLTAVVKANAYGHGLIPVARALERHAGRLAVYELDEAVALRDAGIRAPIHILGPVAPDALETAHATGAAITLWDDDLYARQVASVARRRKAPFPVHAKIDTGVVRLGLTPDEAPQALAHYAETPELALKGVFTHLAAAEELEATFTYEQQARFDAATRNVASGVERHIAATAAAMLWPETRLDAVRCGIGLYGIWPSEATQQLMAARELVLEPALAWRTQFVAVHTVETGTTVGYGRAWTATRPSRIATIPIGYAEGIPRSAGGHAEVLVRGTRVPLVGRVCMDMAFVDITDAVQADSGDTVTLIGADGNERITAEEFASACGTIGYEIVARLPAHIPRRFIDS